MRHWITLSLIVPIGLTLGAASVHFVNPVMKNRVEEPYERAGEEQPTLQYETAAPFPLDSTHPGPMAAWVPPPSYDYYEDSQTWDYNSGSDPYEEDYESLGRENLAVGMTADRAGDAAQRAADAATAAAVASERPPALPAEPRSADGPLPAIW